MFRTAPADARLRLLAACCLGMYAWVTILFLACCVGGFHRSVIWILWSTSVVAAAWTIARHRPAPVNTSRTTTAAPEVGRRRIPRWTTLLGALVLAIVLGLHFVGTVTPNLSWDANTYHLTIPKRYLAAGGFCDIPFSIYAKLPLGVELLFGYAMALDNYVVAKSLQVGAAIGVILAILAFLRHESRWASWIATLLFLASPWLVMEISWAAVDVFGALFFFASLVFAHEAYATQAPNAANAANAAVAERERDGAGPWLILSGICAGLLAGSKANGILGSACVGLYVMWPARRRAWSARTALACFGTPVLVMWIAWLARNYAQTGNPVFPLLYSTLGGPDDWSERLGHQFMAWLRGIGMGRGIGDYLMLPFRIMFHADDPFLGTAQPWWIVLVPISVWAAIRKPIIRPALALGTLYFACWAAGSQQLRLLLPALPLFCVAAALGLHRLSKTILPKSLVTAAMLALFVAGAWHVHKLLVPRVVLAFREWASVPAWQENPLGGEAIPPGYNFVNTHAKPTDTVLLLRTNQAFFLDLPYLADSAFDASQITDWLRHAETAARTHELLAARGVRWIIEGEYAAVQYPKGLTRLLANPAFATVEFSGRHKVYQLR